MESDNSMAELNAVLQALGNTVPPKPDSQGFIKDAKGQSVEPIDPILTSTPQPRPPQHAPPEPTVPFQRIQQAPAAPVQQSTITSQPIQSEPPKPVVPIQKSEETRIFFTGRSGVGKTHITTLLRSLRPDLIVVDGIDSVRDFKALQEAGFAHYHVCCSPMSLEGRTKRPPHPQPLADSLDGNVKLQLMKGGSNHVLHCIWNDPQRIRSSSRLLTLEEFLSQFTS